MRKIVKSVKTSVRKLLKKREETMASAPTVPVPEPSRSTRSSLPSTPTVPAPGPSRPSRSTRSSPPSAPTIPAPEPSRSMRSSPPSANANILCEKLSTFQQLPPNVIHYIADKLPRHSDQAQFARTCRVAREVINAKLKDEAPVILDIRRRSDIEFIHILPDNKTLLILTYDRIPDSQFFILHHMDLETKTYTKRLEIGEIEGISDNKLFIVTKTDRVVKVFDLARGILVYEKTFSSDVKYAVVSNNGTIAVLYSVPISILSQEERDNLTREDERSRTTYRVGIVQPQTPNTITRLEYPGFISVKNRQGREQLKITPNGRHVIAFVSPDPYGFVLNQTGVWDAITGTHITTLNVYGFDIRPSTSSRSVFIDGSVYDLLTGERIAHFYERDVSTNDYKLSNGLKVSTWGIIYSPTDDLVYVIMRSSGARRREFMIALCDVRAKRIILHNDAVEASIFPFSADGKYYTIKSNGILSIVRTSDHKVIKEISISHEQGATFNDKYVVTWKIDKNHRPMKDIIKRWPIQRARPSIPPMPKSKSKGSFEPSLEAPSPSAARGGRRRMRSKAGIS